ncbi:DUF1178 family protein [Roseovarius autotrophicus]|uniref:DUF1178 family protein n=1 Tax=Roseovarius autotrophicus TaxID=2824121 RepID=UPI001A0ECFC9|nr:DUF1178 family protein [Roseovarius autotrophicus]MBE0452420.1 DUF1178 family protein [Roseovarius sp.]
MIRFSLKCDAGHRFDSWFQSAGAFDKLCASGMLACAVCGSGAVDKALMTPQVQHGRADTDVQTTPHPAEQALAELRRRVEEKADYVGPRFAREARDMHEGLIPERAIYGEARPDEARRLIEDGVPVARLPFTPRRRSN